MLKIVHITGLLLTLLWTGGCAIPQFDAAPLEQQLAYTPEVRDAYSQDAKWWEAYGDPQLNSLVETAISRNLDLAKAAVNVNKAMYAARRLDADLLPEFSASAEGGIRRELDGGGSETRQIDSSVGVSYEVDLWSRLADAASAKAWEYRATQEDKEAARLALVTAASDLYFELSYLYSAMAASRTCIGIYRQISGIMNEQCRFGKVGALESEQAAQAVLTEEKRLSGLDIRRKEVENALRLLLDYGPDTPLELSFEKDIGHAAEAVNLDVPVAVLANRPDLRAAEYRLQGAFRDVSAAHAAFYPTITLSAALGASSESVGTIFDVPFTSGSVRINLPFLQWNKIKWNAKISEADYELIRLAFEKKLNTALNETAMACHYYANAAGNLRNAESRHLHARNISDIYRGQYELGKRELADWLEAMNSMWTAWMEVLENRYQTLRRSNEVYKSMAGRYQRAPAETTLKLNFKPNF